MTASPFAEVPSARVSLPGLVRSELIKLKGSLVLVLSAAVPSLVLLLAFLMGTFEGISGVQLGMGTAAFWAQGIMPLGVLALTVVLAQLEHVPRGWDPLLALPGARRRAFLVKLAAATIVLAAWHLVLFVGIAALELFFVTVMPGQISGDVPMGMIGETLVRMYGAAQLMLVVQYGLALYFRSFVPPLLIGFGGILFSLGAAQSKYGIVLPWMMPINQLASESWRADWALGLGLGGGVLAALVLQALMQRREW